MGVGEAPPRQEDGRRGHTYQSRVLCASYGVRHREMEAQCRGWNWCGSLSHSEGVSCNTASHKLGRWYFPRFLLREGSFTQT